MSQRPTNHPRVTRFLKRIRASRKKKGLTQSEMAHMLDMSQGAYCRYETGRANMSLDLAFRIAEALR